MNHQDIQAGPARIWLGVTPPASGDPPDQLNHVDGIPTTGTAVGLTEGDAVFRYQLAVGENKPFGGLSPTSLVATGERAELLFIAQERVYQVLRAAFGGVGAVDDTSKTLFYGGWSGGTIPTPLSQTVVLTSRQRRTPEKFELLILYKAYCPGGLSIPWGRKTRSLVRVTLRGIADTTRTQGDQVFQWVRERT